MARMQMESQHFLRILLHNRMNAYSICDEDFCFCCERKEPVTYSISSKT